MRASEGNTRRLAVLIALLSWVDLALSINEYRLGAGGFFAGISFFLLYYSGWACIFTAVAFTLIATGLDERFEAQVGTAALVGLLLMMAMYWPISGLRHFLASAMHSKILHAVLPALVMIWWATCLKRNTLRYSDSAYCTIFPFLYTVTALVRGRVTSVYPYPQGDAALLGYPLIMAMIAATTAGVLLVGIVLVRINRSSLSFFRVVDRRPIVP